MKKHFCVSENCSDLSESEDDCTIYPPESKIIVCYNYDYDYDYINSRYYRSKNENQEITKNNINLVFTNNQNNFFEKENPENTLQIPKNDKDKKNEENKKKNIRKKNNKKNKIQFRSSTNGEKNRGRIPKKKGQKIHTKTAFDNLQRKIQVNFISFIINVSNDALRSCYGKKNCLCLFKDIPYDIKKEINFESSKKLKQSVIKDILENDISKKYKKTSRFDNKQLLNRVCLENPWLKKFFDMKSLELFKYYYNIEKPLDNIQIYEKILPLSAKTKKKSFSNLIQKYKEDKLKLIDTARSVYFNGYDTLIGKDSFKTEKSEMETNDDD